MSIAKIILIVVAVAIVAFVLFFYFVLKPTIKDVSNNNSLKTLLRQPLTLKRKTTIYFCKPGGYRLQEYVLSEGVPINSEQRYELPMGTIIFINEFKTFKNNLGSGFTEVIALGEWTNEQGAKINFEYSWKTYDGSLSAVILPLAAWQDVAESEVQFRARE
jgi:hypothetical protein